MRQRAESRCDDLVVAVFVLLYQADVLCCYGGEHLRAVGGDDELYAGESIAQLAQDGLLPFGVQVHIDFVNEDDAGGLFYCFISQMVV